MRHALLLLLSALAPLLITTPGRASPFKLIAHRGGVVEEKFPDNSAAALQGAVDRGYYGIEVDLRETKDGVLVMRHDADLQAYYGDSRELAELTWAELEALPSRIPGHRTWRFEELVETARRAGLWLMLDSKNPHHKDFCTKVETILRKADMLDRCLIIGTSDALEHFTGKAPVGKKFKSLKPLVEANPEDAKKYFLFDEGTTLTAEMVRWAQAHQLNVIPSINVYHYYDPATMSGKSREALAPIILAAARRHIEGLQALGVTEFQIDSEFDRFFSAPKTDVAP